MRRGLVETKPGQGTFAVRRFEPFVTTLSADPETGLGGGEGAGAFAEVRERGRYPVRRPFPVLRGADRRQRRRGAAAGPRGLTQVVRRMARERLHRPRQPWSTAGHGGADGTGHARRARFAPRAADLEDGIAAFYLRRQLGIAEIGYRDRILVRSATDEESRFFGLGGDGDSVVSLVRTSYQAGPDGPNRSASRLPRYPPTATGWSFDLGEVPKQLAAPAEG